MRTPTGLIPVLMLLLVVLIGGSGVRSLGLVKYLTQVIEVGLGDTFDASVAYVWVTVVVSELVE